MGRCRTANRRRLGRPCEGRRAHSAGDRVFAPTLEAVARVGKPLVLVTTEPLSAQLTEELADLNHAGLMQVYAVTAKGAETGGAGSLERLLHVTLATRLDARTYLLQVTLEDLGYVQAIQLGADGLTIVPGR